MHMALDFHLVNFLDFTIHLRIKKKFRNFASEEIN